MFRIMMLTILIVFSTTSKAWPGRLFDIESNFETPKIPITLCLLKADTTWDCEFMISSGSSIRIRTLKPSESLLFVNAAIKVAANYKYKYDGCTLLPNQYCVFPVTHNQWSLINIHPLPN